MSAYLNKEHPEPAYQCGRLLAVLAGTEELEVLPGGAQKSTVPTAPAPVAQVQPLVEPLSMRELEVLQLLAAGLANKEIAQRLVISIGTVKNHLKSIYGKLEVDSRTRAVARGRELGLL